MMIIADPDVVFLKKIEVETRASTVKPLLTYDYGVLEQRIADPAFKLSSIILNPKIAFPNGLPIVEQLIKHKPMAAIFFLADPDDAVEYSQDLQNMAVHKVLRKPIVYSQIMKEIAPDMLSFNSKEALDHATQSLDKLGEASNLEEKDFTPIVSECFLPGSVSFFDLYVRLASGRQVKILQAGDNFDEDRLNAYTEKGVSRFYIRKSAQEYYLNYCQQLTQALMKNVKVPISMKVSQTLNVAQETTNFFKMHGMDAQVLSHATQFLNSVRSLVRLMELDKDQRLSSFFSNLIAYEHGAATTLVAALLLKPLGMDSEKSLHTVGLASLLHDVGLQSMDLKFLDEDELILTTKERELYHSHPEVGAQILQGIDGIEASVVQAVEQHHERRNRKGFPKKLGLGAINRVAEIVGISEELVRAIERSSKKSPESLKIFNPILALERQVFDGFSTPVIEAFKSLF